MTITSTQANGSGGSAAPIQERDRVTVRFAGDSGDGMQLAGNRFADATAVFGNDFSTLPDFQPRSAPPPDHWPAFPASRFPSRSTKSSLPATSPTHSWR